MTPREFHQRYLNALPKVPAELEIKINEFEVFDKTYLKKENLHQEDLELLTTIGLPRDAAPFLSFRSRDAQERNKWLFGVSEIESYLLLGSNGSGDNIVLDKRTRKVVLFNHDDNMRRVFINSNILKLAECLCVYAEHFHNRQMDSLFQAFLDVDPPCIKWGSFWSEEIRMR